MREALTTAGPYLLALCALVAVVSFVTSARRAGRRKTPDTHGW